MSMAKIYLYGVGQKVIIPTVVETEGGSFLETAPVKIFDVHQLGEWKTLVYQNLTKGNKLVQAPENDVTPGSPILEKLHIAKWADFEKSAVMYTIHVGPRYIGIYSTGRDKDGRWTAGATERKFEGRAPLEAVIEELANDLIKQPESVPKPMLLLGG